MEYKCVRTMRKRALLACLETRLLAYLRIGVVVTASSKLMLQLFAS